MFQKFILIGVVPQEPPGSHADSLRRDRAGQRNDFPLFWWHFLVFAVEAGFAAILLSLSFPLLNPLRSMLCPPFFFFFCLLFSGSVFTAVVRHLGCLFAAVTLSFVCLSLCFAESGLLLEAQVLILSPDLAWFRWIHTLHTTCGTLLVVFVVCRFDFLWNDFLRHCISRAFPSECQSSILRTKKIFSRGKLWCSPSAK